MELDRTLAPPEGHPIVASAAERLPDELSRGELVGVVNTVYLGGFAMEAGASAELSGQATVFGVGAGASSAHSSERLAREGDAAACEEALKSGKETALCSVPLRVGLLALDGLASDGSGVAAGSQATSAGPGTCPDGLIPMEGGAFVMGAQKQRVDVAPFCIEKTEVTSGAYAACVASGKCRAPAESDKPLCNFRKDGRDGHPMNCVTYDEAKMECQARGLLLPTEQQWEWAARGNGQRTFPWGEDQELDRACVDRDKDGGTCEASAHPKGATPSGVLGLAGNVAEWVELRTGNPGSAGGDWSDKSLRDLEPRRRNLSATVILVIDSVNGVEAQTRRLMEVCRMLDTPVIVFVNKMDRDGKNRFDLLEEVEKELSIALHPMTWPINSGKEFKGVYNLHDKNLVLFTAGTKAADENVITVSDLNDEIVNAKLGERDAAQLREDVDLVDGVHGELKIQDYLDGKVAPVFFGSAVNNFGVKEMLDTFMRIAPHPRSRETTVRPVDVEEEKMSGFVFKIHGNLDPKHRDRIECQDFLHRVIRHSRGNIGLYLRG